MRARIWITMLSALLCAPAAADEATRSGRDEPYGPHFATMDEMMATKPKPNVNENGIGILVYDGVNALDVIGPMQVFSAAGLNTFLVAKQKGPIKANNGVSMVVEKSLNEVSRLDILVVPGGASETAQQAQNEETLRWVRQIDTQSIYTTSVCTGAWVLGAAGLLKDKEASANWYRAKDLLARYGAHYTGERWTRDGKYWTSAGVTAGMDMALAIVNHLFGYEYTQAVMLDLEYDPQPPIQGGSVATTLPSIAKMMQEMYDSFLSWFSTPGATPPSMSH